MAPLETTVGKQAALQNHWFHNMEWYILALRWVAGGPLGGKVTAMRCRNLKKGPEGPREEGLDDQRLPKGREKGAQGKSTGDHKGRNMPKC